MSLRVLFAHNTYQYRGGEDSVVEAELELLRRHGHDVEIYTRHNDAIDALSRPALARQTLWSSRSVIEMGRLVKAFKPDVIHVHNTFPLISPSIYWAAARAGVPVVQTLHNFRLLCPQAMLLRDGQVCEDCLGHVPWRGVLHACYRGSVAQSGALAVMLMLHRGIGTFRKKITSYIALNDFCRDVFVRGGLPADRIRVKPNFVDIPPPPPAIRAGFLYVGRLSSEKGIKILADALIRLAGAKCEIIGTGPEEVVMRDALGVHLAGWQEADYIVGRMRTACALVMPSLWYENFPRILVEAFACGLPVIASRLGAMATLIHDGETGLLFKPGNVADLAEKMRWALDNPEAMQSMGEAARATYEAKYTPERNYEILMEIYQEAIAEVKSDVG
jgi:glycosyltransferase involved in cell wall biosynthesis